MDPAAEEYTKRTERIKQLLSSYYGTEGGPAPESEASGDAAEGSSFSPGEVRSGGSAAMDSAAYSAERYVSQTLKSSSLAELMDQHRKMAKEIKNLDSDMQQLVYENYNKFIAATDTIRSMKSNIDGMGNEMEKLKTVMDGVSEKSNVVNLKLQRRRDHIEELNKVQGVLRKLQAVFDLPKKMRAALEQDILDSAVSFYAEALPLLKKHGNRGAFRTVATESDAVAKEISQVLKKRLAERKDDTEQCVLLLRKLGEPDDTLQDKYLQGRSYRLRRILKEASAVVESMAAAANGEAVPEVLLKKIENLTSWGFADKTPPSLKVFIRSFDERVINAMMETVVNVTTIFLQNDPSPQKRRPLVQLARDVFQEYLKLVKRAVATAATTAVHCAARVKEAAEDFELALDGASLKFSSDWGADTLAQALSLIATDLGILEKHLPELSLKDQGVEVVEHAVKYHMQVCFSSLNNRVINVVTLIRDRLNDPGQAGEASTGQYLRRAFAFASDLLQRGLSALLQGLRVYENHSRLLATWHNSFVDLVQGQLQHFFLSLLSNFLDVTSIKYDGQATLHNALRTSSCLITDDQVFSALSEALAVHNPLSPSAGSGSSLSPRVGSTDPPKSGLVLLLVKLCIYMEQQSLPFVMETIASVFTSRSGLRGEDAPPAFVAGEVARRLTTASNALLAAYVELHGRQLSLIVRRSVAASNWLHHKEPRGQRTVCDVILERLTRAEQEVLQLVDQTGHRTGPDTKYNKPAGKDWDQSLALETGNVERNVAKLFRGKVKIFGNVQFTQSNLLAAIAGVGLKSLVECIRLQTLGRAGLQQLQLDCHYLRPLLRRFTGGPSSAVVEQLLGEVVSAGVERSSDPQLLEPAVMDRILSSCDG